MIILTFIICTISLFSIVPLPSMSYIEKAQFSLSLTRPEDVMLMARRNSLKSIVPPLSVSKVLNTCSQNPSAFPLGKNSEYTSRNFSLLSCPPGQSLYKVKNIVLCLYDAWKMHGKAYPLQIPVNTLNK